MKRAAFHTLGCRLNQAETALTADDLSRHGYTIVPWGEAAELLVINTCAVTGMASQKSRHVFRAARRAFPDAFIVIMGCDANVDRTKWDVPGGPDLVVPHPHAQPLSQLLPRELTAACPRFAAAGERMEDFTIPGAAHFQERTRANLKIQDGCNFFCSYCIVPYSRGRARSRDLEDVVREARELLAAGYKELVLCGVNLTTYSSRGADLADLLEIMAKLPGDFRLRLGSSEPGNVVSKVVELMAGEPKICRFLHLPLQYGENEILKRMRRHYTAEEYYAVAMSACNRIPGLCLGADVIAGFPGETDETFQKCVDFVEKLPFGLLHVFPYSPRPGTAAASFPGKVNAPLANCRASRLAAVAAQKAEDFAKSQIGKSLQILVEEENPSSGWSDNYLHVTFHETYLERNTMVKANITGADGGRELCAAVAGKS